MLGGYVSNCMQMRDARVVNAGIFDVVDSSVLNVYEVVDHGDFRLVQYDVSIKTILNPTNKDEILPFGKPVLMGVIAGPHSVEATFLACLINYAHFEQFEISCLASFDEWIGVLKENGQIFGNYADAGHYQEGLESCYFDGVEAGNLPSIATAGEGCYTPKIENGDLLFYFSHQNTGRLQEAFKVTPGMVSDLVKGLFIKTGNGNGRSSIKELEGLVRYYLKHFIEAYA